MPRTFKTLVCLALVAFSLSAFARDEPVALTEKDIFAYLDQSIAWYRAGTAEVADQTRPSEMLIGTSLKSNMLRTLRLSFDFARINAAQLDNMVAVKAKETFGPSLPTPQEDKEGQPNFERIKKTIEDKIVRIQKDLAAVQAARIGPALRTAERSKLNAELTLATAQKELIDKIANGQSQDENLTLLAQVNELARTIPELEKKKKTTTTAAATTTQATTNGDTQPSAASAVTALVTGVPVIDTDAPKAPEPKGLIRMGSDVISIFNRKNDVLMLAASNKEMQKENQEMRERIREELLQVVARSDALGQQMVQDVTVLNDAQRELTALTERFRQIGDSLVPLAEQGKTLQATERNFKDWQVLLNKDFNEAVHRLAMRLLGLAIAVLIPLGLSELARRAGIKYIHDTRHRRQLTIVRRVIFWFVIGLIIILNLMTEFGSMATFVGFVTAGLAVALQNVILSIVAYFFYFGRYGIRVGTRVTIGNTTGDVIETGLVRLYLMEMTDKQNGRWQPTGRIVAYPNSIIFQPAGFFKQVPGVKFPMREIIFWLPRDTDRSLATQKLSEAADAVHEDNKVVLEVQRAALAQSSNIHMAVPYPRGKLVTEDERIGFSLTYPVPADQSEEIDGKVKQLVRDILDGDPKLSRLHDEPELR
jgi:hypothetical protein